MGRECARSSTGRWLPSTAANAKAERRATGNRLKNSQKTHAVGRPLQLLVSGASSSRDDLANRLLKDMP